MLGWNYIYIYIYRERERERERDKKEEFNVKESQPYNVSVLMNHHQDEKGWYRVTDGFLMKCKMRKYYGYRERGNCFWI